MSFRLMTLTAVAVFISITPAASGDDPPKPAAESVSPQTNDDEAAKQAAEEVKTVNIQTTYKLCLGERSSEGSKKTYSQKEIDDYCGCFAVLINERVTNEEWQAELKAGTWAKNLKLLATTRYCREKYSNLPDVTAIKKKEMVK
jgi:hypothetical protein